MQESIKESMQHQLQEVEKRRYDFIPEHWKVQKRHQKIQSIQDKRKNLQKENAAAQEEMKTLAMSSDFGFSRKKSIRTEWRMQKWQENFRDCRQEKKEEAAMHRK